MLRSHSATYHALRRNIRRIVARHLRTVRGGRRLRSRRACSRCARPASKSRTCLSAISVGIYALRGLASDVFDMFDQPFDLLRRVLGSSIDVCRVLVDRIH